MQTRAMAFFFKKKAEVIQTTKKVKERIITYNCKGLVSSDKS